MFLQPLRDVGAKELALFCHLQRLPTTQVPSIHTQRRLAPSINSISDRFVAQLQVRGFGPGVYSCRV